jgi:hypothetical protein
MGLYGAQEKEILYSEDPRFKKNISYPNTEITDTERLHNVIDVELEFGKNRNRKIF